MNQTMGKLTRSAPTAAPGDAFPSLATKTQNRADMLSHRIEEIVHNSFRGALGKSVGANDRVHRELTVSDTFEEKMPRLVTVMLFQFVESGKLEATIRQNLKGLGYAL